MLSTYAMTYSSRGSTAAGSKTATRREGILFFHAYAICLIVSPVVGHFDTFRYGHADFGNDRIFPVEQGMRPYLDSGMYL